MNAETQKIKDQVQKAAGGSLEMAAKVMSNKEYSFSASTLSKVIHGKRKTGKVTSLIQRRIEKLIGEQVFRNAAQVSTKKSSVKNKKCSTLSL